MDKSQEFVCPPSEKGEVCKADAGNTLDVGPSCGRGIRPVGSAFGCHHQLVLFRGAARRKQSAARCRLVRTSEQSRAIVKLCELLFSTIGAGALHFDQLLVDMALCFPAESRCLKELKAMNVKEGLRSPPYKAGHPNGSMLRELARIRGDLGAVDRQLLEWSECRIQRAHCRP